VRINVPRGDVRVVGWDEPRVHVACSTRKSATSSF
jgi:hypothetical protein